jgi:hypothetical protein
MKTPIEFEDETTDELDAVLTGLLVIALTLLSAGLIGLFLGVLWGWMS